MSKPRLIALLAAAGALLAASPANAVITVTYEGLVASGSDLTGLFGAPGGDLAGATFTARFTLDLDRGATTLNPPTSSSYDYFYPVDFSTLTDATLTINDILFEPECQAADTCGVQHMVSAAGPWSVSSGISVFAVDTSASLFWNHNVWAGLASAANPFVGWDFRLPFSYAYQPGDTFSGGFELYQEVVPGDGPNYYNYFAQGTLMPLSVSVAIPEPATWALMILGFGAAGVALRRRAFSAPAA